jgi:hypothetical protein
MWPHEWKGAENFVFVLTRRTCPGDNAAPLYAATAGRDAWLISAPTCQCKLQATVFRLRFSGMPHTISHSDQCRRWLVYPPKPL